MRRARRPREGGHLAEEGHRRAARRRPQEVRRAVHQAPEGGRAPLPRGQQGAHQRADATRCPRRSPPRSTATLEGVGRAGRHAPPLGGRRLALDGHGRGELDRLARHRRAAARRPRRRCKHLRAEVKKEGFRTSCCWAWAAPACAPRSGRRPSAASPGSPSCSCSTPPTRRRSTAVEDKIDLDEDAVHRLEQVRLDPRAQHLQGLLLRPREAGASAPTRRRSRFVAVTDPGSNLEKEAKGDGFRHIFPGVKSIGGRYSALSNFGMVPAAAMGLDVRAAARRGRAHAARLRARRARGGEPRPRARHDPGPGRATRGIDKLTLVASPGIHDLGAWLEQLIAESTGKEGKGIIPVDRERARRRPRSTATTALRLPAARGRRRTPRRTRPSTRSRRRASPWCASTSPRNYDLAEEFVRWEIATAIAGAVLGINPFNQPDVEASKIATTRADLRVREDGQAARGGAVLRGRRREALRRRQERRRAAEGRGRVAVAGRVPEGPPRPRGQGRLLRRSSPTCR